MKNRIFDNINRCLQCKVPQCQQGCPICTPIPDAIKLLLDGKITEAGELLFRNNPLSIVCCHVCPQENQCEGRCVLGKKGMPIEVSAIEKYTSDYFLNIYQPTKSTKTSGKIAVIGGGPSGLTTAFYLSDLNYDVTIFERHSHIGGVLRYGIPEFRLPREYLNRFKDVLVSKGVTIRQNTTIGRNITVDDMLRDGYKAVFIGAGVWKPRKLKVPGESFGNVHYALDYLKKPETYSLGKRVIVIGAGNVAMDAARTAFRYGSTEVDIVCLGDGNSIMARPIERSYAELDGAKFLFNKETVEFKDDGVVLRDILSDKCKTYKADSYIVAIGQEPRNVIVSNTVGIEVDNNGRIIVDEKGQTTRDGIFSSGDVVTGAKTVVEAVKSAKTVAKYIDEYVKNS